MENFIDLLNQLSIGKMIVCGIVLLGVVYYIVQGFVYIFVRKRK
jgi:hypothetical protein